MRKLKLQLEDLMIDSFTTTPAEKAKGTVFGEQCTCYTACTCPGCPTCYASCGGSCDATCNGTCGATCDWSCGGTCEYSCNGDTCVAGCETYATSPGPNQVCNFCA
jgi:hypothetical protein